MTWLLCDSGPTTWSPGSYRSGSFIPGSVQPDGGYELGGSGYNLTSVGPPTLVDGTKRPMATLNGSSQYLKSTTAFPGKMSGGYQFALKFKVSTVSGTQYLWCLDTAGSPDTGASFYVYLASGVVHVNAVNTAGAGVDLADAIFGVVPTGQEIKVIIRVDPTNGLNLNVNGAGWNTPSALTGTLNNAGTFLVGCGIPATPTHFVTGSVGPLVWQQGIQSSGWETAVLAWL